MKLLKKTIMAGALIGASAFVTPALAEQKIAVVNVQAILQSLPQAAAIGQAIQEEFKDQIQNVQSKQDEFRFLGEKLQRESATMSEDEQVALQEQIIALRNELQQLSQPLQQSIQARQDQETTKLLGLVQQAIDGIAAKEGIDLVLNSNAVAFASADLNISQQVQEQVSKAQ